jgi:hypothetical protein
VQKTCSRLYIPPSDLITSTGLEHQYFFTFIAERTSWD